MVCTITIELAGGFDDDKYRNIDGCYLHDALRRLIKSEYGLQVGGRGYFYIYSDKDELAEFEGVCPDFNGTICADAGERGENFVRQVNIPDKYLI